MVFEPGKLIRSIDDYVVSHWGVHPKDMLIVLGAKVDDIYNAARLGIPELPRTEEEWQPYVREFRIFYDESTRLACSLFGIEYQQDVQPPEKVSEWVNDRFIRRYGAFSKRIAEGQEKGLFNDPHYSDETKKMLVTLYAYQGIQKNIADLNN
jgi:hypothetical protein